METAEVVLPAPRHRAVRPRQVLDGRLLRLDLPLDLHPALALGHDLHGGCAELLVLKHLQTPGTLAEHVVDCPLL